MRAASAFSSGPVGFAGGFVDVYTDQEAYARRYFRFYLPYWRLDWPGGLTIPRQFRSSAFLLWYPGVLLNMLLWSKEVLNLAVVSLPARLALIAFYAALLWWLRRAASPVQSLGLTAIVGLPVALLLTADDYADYLNSFYFESAGLVFVPWFLAALLGVSRSKAHKAAALCQLLLAALAVGSAKAAWAYWPIVAALGCILAWRRAGLPKGKRWLQLLLAPVAVVLSAFCLRFHGPTEYTLTMNSYHRLFKGLIALSSHPELQLERLGLPEAARCVGTSPWSPEGQECLALVQPSLGLASTARVILGEPLVLVRGLRAMAGHMQFSGLESIGRLPERDPRASLRAGPAALWWAAKRSLFPRGDWLFVTLALGLALSSASYRSAGPRGQLGMAALVCLISIPFDMLAAFLGEGLADASKHLFLANLCFDLALIALTGSCWVWLVETVETRLRATELRLLEFCGYLNQQPPRRGSRSAAN